jgi:hypothetical protein
LLRGFARTIFVQAFNFSLWRLLGSTDPAGRPNFNKGRLFVRHALEFDFPSHANLTREIRRSCPGAGDDAEKALSRGSLRVRQLASGGLFHKTEFALHPLNYGSQRVASLLSIGFAESSALKVPIRFVLRFRRLTFNDNVNKMFAIRPGLFDGFGYRRFQRHFRNRLSDRMLYHQPAIAKSSDTKPHTALHTPALTFSTTATSCHYRHLVQVCQQSKVDRLG